MIQTAHFISMVLVWLRRDALVLFLFAAIALAVLYPVLPAPRSLVLGEPGDNIQHAYLVGWVGQALLLGESPFIDPRLNYPADLALPATDASFLGMLAVAPATWLLGPAFSYNLLMFLAHMFTGYFTYLWVVNLTGSRAGGLVAGLIFVLCPYRMVRSYGQLNLISTQMIPLFFWALDSTLTNPANNPKPREWSLWLLGGATLLVGGLSQYHLVMCLVTGAVYALLTLLPRRPRAILHPGWRLVVSVGFGTLISILPYISMLSSGTFQPFGVGRTRLWSADPVNFVLPSNIHPLWGTWIEQLRPEQYWAEKTLYLGLIAVLLAVVGFWKMQERRRWVWLGVALVSAVFALGTDLWIANEPIERDAPFWLPSYYLAHLPLLGSMRVWARFGIITIFFVALLAGMGTAHIMSRLHFWRWPVLVLLTALIVVDFLPGYAGVTRLEPRPIDQWLAEQPGDFAVAFLPAEHDVANYRAIYGSLFHAKQMPAFVHSRHMPPAYRDFMHSAVKFPAPATIEEMRELHLRYIILEQALFTGWRTPAWEDVAAALAEIPDLRTVTEIDGFVVLEFAEDQTAQ